MWTGIRLIEDSSVKTEMIVPLTWRTINSWKTMFFAGIAAGVDITGGFACLELAQQNNVGILYKDMNIKFLRRVDSDLNLICNDIEKIHACAQDAIDTNTRQNVVVDVRGYCYKYSKEKPVISASLTLSMKIIQ